MLAIKDQMEKIYQGMPLETIPWNMEAPPAALTSLTTTIKFRPYKVIEFGCGSGNYVLYLAQQGFDVTGIDISNAAIEIAKKAASEKGVTCKLIVADVLSDMREIQETFDFAYDWELLHHIYPEDREQYVKNVYRLLKHGGRYLSVCFSEKSTQFGGEGKYRKTPINTVLYFSSESEMKSLFDPFFEIEVLNTIDIQGKFASHKAIYALLKKI
jgi:cyclopropane fatty-acyl-phospholipid synthase-like methyltransferase